MRVFLRHSTLLFLTGLLLVSVSGINLYVHYCSCEDLNYVTALPLSTCCEHETNHDECCGIGSYSPSCCGEGGNDCPDTHITRSVCCTNQQLYIKLNADLNSQIKQYQDKLVPVDFNTFSTEEHSTHLLSRLPVIHRESPPLLLYGKDLLNYLHQRRLDC